MSIHGKRSSESIASLTLSGNVKTVDFGWPSFLERGVPSPPTLMSPTRLAADAIHLLPGRLLSTICGTGDDGRFPAWTGVEICFIDAMVGDMKRGLGLIRFSSWEGVKGFTGTASRRRGLMLFAFEVMSVKVPILLPTQMWFDTVTQVGAGQYERCSCQARGTRSRTQESSQATNK